MVYKSLSSLARIHAGITFNPVFWGDGVGREIYLLQPKDVVIGESISNLENVMRVPFPGRVTNALETGDIVLVSRCTESGFFRAVIYTGEGDGVVTGSSLLVLRVTSNAITSEYLVSFLNSVTGQSELHRLARGATIKFLPQGLLRELSVPILPKEQQKAFVEFEQAIRRQVKLLDEKKSIFHKLLNGTSQSLFSPNV